jgi:hypothetical protein
MSDRGLSVTVNYVIGLAVATLLITGLLYAAGDVVEDRRESTTRAELRVVGEGVAADLMTADRLAQAGAETVVVEVSAPDAVAGSDYSVGLNASTGEVVLETAEPSVTVRVPFGNRTPVATSTTNGGDVEIVLSGTGELEVVSA